MSVIQKISGDMARRPWQPPTYTMPMPISPKEMQRLGDIRGREWFEWNGRELEADPELLPIHASTIPNGPMLRVEIDGREYVRCFRTHRPGTFASRAVVAISTAPPPPPAARPVDMFKDVQLLTGTSGAGQSARHYKVRGAAGILARLGRNGTDVAVRLTADRSGLVVTGPAGRAAMKYIDVVERATPLLLPYLLTGAGPSCQVTAHPEPVEAVTIAAPRVPWCGECVPE